MIAQLRHDIYKPYETYEFKRKGAQFGVCE